MPCLTSTRSKCNFKGCSDIHICKQMNFDLLRRCLAFLVAATVSTRIIGGEVVPQERGSIIEETGGALYPGTISGGVKGNDAYVDGHFSIVAPVWSTLGADG